MSLNKTSKRDKKEMQQAASRLGCLLILWYTCIICKRERDRKLYSLPDLMMIFLEHETTTTGPHGTHILDLRAFEFVALMVRIFIALPDLVCYAICIFFFVRSIIGGFNTYVILFFFLLSSYFLDLKFIDLLNKKKNLIILILHLNILCNNS